ncbi:MAG: CPBP family intramembrane metalloprotease [Candidatus Omnitrophica bacterium]|nr:CPBP family intramembrane metalloprotease [Candidatus Omnitrophota bacterium]
MKSFLKFLLVFSTILILSAVLAPIAYTFLDFKFERIFNRLVMIFTLIAVVRYVRINKEHLRQYGLGWQSDESAFYFWSAVIVGVLSLVVLFVVKAMTGHLSLSIRSLNALQWTGVVAGSAATGLLIGVIEEFFFRGFIYKTLHEHFRWNMLWSIVITSIFYALLHFVNFQKPFVGPEPTVWDSCRLMAAPLLSLLHIQQYWNEVLGLFFFGMILNLLVIQSRSLYPAIGLHGGCVFMIKMDGFLTFSNDQMPLVFTSGKIYDGLLGWIFLWGIYGILRLIISRHLNKAS